MPHSRVLTSLARAYGLQVSYTTVDGKRRRASVDAMAAVLRSLGAPLRSPEDAPAALDERRRQVARQPIEPVVVSWNGAAVEVPIKLAKGARFDAWLSTEDGRRLPTRLAAAAPEEVDGERFDCWSAEVPEMPLGYHHLVVETSGANLNTMVIAAPERAYRGPGRAWGAFLPLYALRTADDWGAGDYGGLERLARWTRGSGGSLVGTLPLLPCFLDGPSFDPSPYAPVTRLGWNELYVDPTATTELAECPEAGALVDSPDFQRQLKSARADELIDYRQVMAQKRAVLELLARRAFDSEEGRGRVEAFLQCHPHIASYARFRAVEERQAKPWRQWPERLRDGEPHPGDYDEDAYRYHAYVQLLADGQVEAVGRACDLYLDYPVGVHADGFDTWRERDAFLDGVTAGAPPDAFFSHGQSWGFPPPHPDADREGGYRYLTAALRHHMRAAGLLRIDHVMGLHRMYWVPRGHEASDGVYVRYRFEEAYAVLCLESHRHRTALSGEDLGTVPREVPAAMRRHGMSGLFVAQFNLDHRRRPPLARVPSGAVASLDTHDTPTFAAFWRGLDIDGRVDLGLLDAKGARKQRVDRLRTVQAASKYLGVEHGDIGRTMNALLARMSGGPSTTVVLNLEDAWLEEKPQNVPGTAGQRPNWRRRARYDIDEIESSPAVAGAIESVESPGVQ